MPLVHSRGFLNRIDDRRQAIRDLFVTESMDERDSPWLIFGVENLDQLHKLFGFKFGPDFDADWIFYATAIFNMSPVEITGSIANPRHVRAHVVPPLATRDASRLSLFVAQMERFMRREKVD